ncbi:hypothetical protein [Belnapia rosea]|uniref:Uncharacterized protein n=1 Tax=Belnapia rosea TaxID=938405 RepID=A0A1G6Z457_9PROT|nr:hypothetical protein [Belnapia rosea]SDD97053.1 hypothetical protein SAMN04487779_1015107 [Belnapia rosea]
MPRRAAMSRPDPTLERAIDRYCAAFGRDAPPCIVGLDSAMAGAAAIMLADAVTARRPLRYCAIADALGGSQPPERASL